MVRIYRSPDRHSSLNILALVAFGLQHNLQAFVFAHNPDGPDAVFSHLGAWVNVMKAVDFVFQTAIGDAILVRLLIPHLIVTAHGTRLLDISLLRRL